MHFVKFRWTFRLNGNFFTTKSWHSLISMAMKNKPLQIVCLGAGYLTIHAVRTLMKSIRKGIVEVSVIDRNNYHVFHGLVAEVLTGKLSLGDIVSPARKLFKGLDFINGEIESVDFEAKEVVTTRLLDGKRFRINYDHLIIGMGSTDDLDKYPGVSENTFRLKVYSDVVSLRNHIISLFEYASIEEDPEERRELLTFVIAGGNYAGIEVAVELDEFAGDMTRYYFPQIGYEEVRIIVLHSGAFILPELGERFPGLLKYAEKKISETNIQIHYNERIQSATPVSARTNKGLEISSRTIISCVGNAQSPLFDQWPVERHESGRLLTDAYFRLAGKENLWAGGDCAAAPHPKGGYCPPLAIYAMKAGKQISKNILRSIQNKPLAQYRFTGLGDACTLAHRRAVGHLYGIPFSGWLAWVAWRIFMFKYLPIWEKKIRTAIDWCIWPFVGRDIASYQSDKQLQVKELFFEPGQDVIVEGEDGNTMFIIYEGEAAISKEGHELGQLKRGDYFGELDVLGKGTRSSTVKSITRLRLLEIRKHLVTKLKKALE